MKKMRRGGLRVWIKNSKGNLVKIPFLFFILLMSQGSLTASEVCVRGDLASEDATPHVTSTYDKKLDLGHDFIARFSSEDVAAARVEVFLQIESKLFSVGGFDLPDSRNYVTLCIAAEETPLDKSINVDCLKDSISMTMSWRGLKGIDQNRPELTPEDGNISVAQCRGVVLGARAK